MRTNVLMLVLGVSLLTIGYSLSGVSPFNYPSVAIGTFLVVYAAVRIATYKY